MTAHPYSAKPDYCFWRRSVGSVPAPKVDPVVKGRFRIRSADLVATAGSCFAQHIARHLTKSNFNYFVTEPLNPFVQPHLATDYNYGTFSARYGNIYVARQFKQLLERAYGLFKPIDDVWHAADGKLIDPYRPQIQPDGFASLREFYTDRDKHFAAVRAIVEKSDVLVFTLGLTESWENVEDGAIYPLCPGAAGGAFDPERHRFVNFRMTEVLRDLSDAFAFIRERNPRIRFIITVSPVPLVATAEDRHVLVSTTYSKSVLRTVCGELEAQFEDVAYFPSYEVITGAFNRGAYYGPDLRDVTESGVQHVMRLFMQHYAEADTAPALPKVDDLVKAPAAASVKAKELASRVDAIAEVICDEVALDR